MLRYLPVLLMYAAEVLMVFQQTDYTMKTERGEIGSFNKKNAYAAVRNFKLNRTYIAINFTVHFEHDWGNNLRVEVQAYKFASNEYRLFPITFNVDYCETVKNNDFGTENIYACGNFSRCPMTKGHYLICNWGPDYAKFPPYVPHGRYRADVKFLYHSEEVFLFQYFMTVEGKRLI